MTKKRKESDLKKIIIESWRRRMKAAKISQRALSAESDVSEHSISEIISGNSVNLRKDTIEAIESALDELESRRSSIES